MFHLCKMSNFTCLWLSQLQKSLWIFFPENIISQITLAGAKFWTLCCETGLHAWTRILLFSHYGSLIHKTMLYLPCLFWHVSKIRNLLHVIELRKSIGWYHDGDPNVNGECRKSHSASHPLDAKYGSHASQPKPSTFCSNPSTLTLQFPSTLFTTIPTYTTHVSTCSGPGSSSTYLFSSHTKEPKILNPLLFSGKRDDMESFINEYCLYVNGCKLEFPNEDVKIYWILSYMQTGSVKTWHDYVVALMFKRQQLFSMSDELLREIDQKFSDMDKRTMQSLKIRTMQQGDKSVDEHIQDFEKAALEAGYEGYSLVVEFKHSLNLGLRKNSWTCSPCLWQYSSGTTRSKQ